MDGKRPQSPRQPGDDGHGGSASDAAAETSKIAGAARRGGGEAAGQYAPSAQIEERNGTRAGRPARRGARALRSRTVISAGGRSARAPDASASAPRRWPREPRPAVRRRDAQNSRQGREIGPGRGARGLRTASALARAKIAEIGPAPSLILEGAARTPSPRATIARERLTRSVTRLRRRVPSPVTGSHPPSPIAGMPGRRVLISVAIRRNRAHIGPDLRDRRAPV